MLGIRQFRSFKTRPPTVRLFIPTYLVILFLGRTSVRPYQLSHIPHFKKKAEEWVVQAEVWVVKIAHYS